MSRTINYPLGIIGKEVLAFIFVYGFTSFWVCNVNLFSKTTTWKLRMFGRANGQVSYINNLFCLNSNCVCLPCFFSFPTFGSFDSRLKMFITLLILWTIGMSCVAGIVATIFANRIWSLGWSLGLTIEAKPLP